MTRIVDPMQLLEDAACMIENHVQGHGSVPQDLRTLALGLKFVPKKPEPENESDPAVLPLSRAHVALGYWMGRTLGDGSLTVKQWVKFVTRVAGEHTLVTQLTERQAKAVLALGNPPDPEMLSTGRIN